MNKKTIKLKLFVLISLTGFILMACSNRASFNRCLSIEPSSLNNNKAEIVVKCEYYHNDKKAYMYGVIDFEGNFIIPPHYYFIKQVVIKGNDYFLVLTNQTENIMMVLDEKNNLVLENVNFVSHISNTTFLIYLHNGFVTLLDIEGGSIVQTDYKDFATSDGYVLVEYNQLWYQYDYESDHLSEWYFPKAPMIYDGTPFFIDALDGFKITYYDFENEGFETLSGCKSNQCTFKGYYQGIFYFWDNEFDETEITLFNSDKTLTVESFRDIVFYEQVFIVKHDDYIRVFNYELDELGNEELIIGYYGDGFIKTINNQQTVIKNLFENILINVHDEFRLVVYNNGYLGIRYENEVHLYNEPGNFLISVDAICIDETPYFIHANSEFLEQNYWIKNLLINPNCIDLIDIPNDSLSAFNLQFSFAFGKLVLFHDHYVEILEDEGFHYYDFEGNLIYSSKSD
ncbi:MAG: hypothetical protein ACNA7U_02770 [Candidatus Izemoplasmataceae bacterium]|uniref:hypothetical protein n=1 Tax=Liberiplasma polymorphum TaxID=3374570 RepID=UPI003774A7C3